MTRFALPAVIAGALACGGGVDRPAGPDYAIQPVPLDAVQMTDGFWQTRLEANRRVTVPHIFRQNEETGRVANLEKGAGRREGAYEGRRFNDTDVYKAIEAASFSLVRQPDAALAARIDALVELIGAAQEPDGYVFPARTIDPGNPAPGVGPARWVHLNGSHELYNFGHLYEAAVAHFQATGRRTLLDIALKNADLVDRDFGPDARRAAPGHEEIELALVKLYRVTGERRYLELAKFFIDQRGREHDTEPYPEGTPFAMYNDRSYKQDHAPVAEQDRAVGHAVRAVYLYAGVADVAALTADEAYQRAVDRLWEDVAAKRIYVTGGLGARGTVEAFGDDYELPNRTAYTETCASVGGVLWHHRMFLRHGDGRYLDVLERTLYNGLLSGVSLAGDTFFYQNPLESAGNRERSAYFDVACCPANLARLIEQVPGLVYARRDDTIFVNLYGGSDATVDLDGQSVRIAQTTRYPWDGEVAIRVGPERAGPFTLALRVPGWARNEAIASDLYRFADPSADTPIVTVNGAAHPLDLDRGFVHVRRTWRPDDIVQLTLPMPVRRVAAHEGIEDNRGRIALQRGPLVYCLERPDNTTPVLDLAIPRDGVLRHEFRDELLGGVEVITGPAVARSTGDATTFVGIPYFAWANRGRGEMVVWIPQNAR